MSASSSTPLASPYDSPYDYDDTALPGLRRCSSASRSSASWQSSSFRRRSSAMSNGSRSAMNSRSTPSIAAAAGAGAGFHQTQRRSSSACWIQDGGGGSFYEPPSSSSYSPSSSEDELPEVEDTSISYDHDDCEGDAAYLLDGSARGSPSKPTANAYPFARKNAGKKGGTSSFRRYGWLALTAVAAATALAIVVASFRLGGAFARRFLEGSGGKTVGLQPLKGENNDVNGHQPPHHDHHHLMRGGAEDDNQHTHQPANNQKQVVKPHHREDHWDLQHELASLRAELEAKERELEQIVNARNQQQQQQADKEGSLAAAAPHKSADPNDAIPLDHKFKLASLIKTTAYDLYGMDNHEVEFHVRYYPDAKSQEPVDGVFFAEIADFETTPLSSFLFLEQVNHGLWDDTSFPVNAPHMLLAQPTSVYSIRNHTLVESNTVAPRRSRLPEMQALGLDRLPIMEYEDDFGKHSKYTIGFGGSSSSAGSYFFINKADNTRAHENQACFGNIIEGVDVIENIFSLQDHDANFKLRRPVEIVSARVIPHRDNHEHDHDEEGGEGDHHDHHAEHADHHDELHDHTRDHAQHDEHHEHRLDHHDAGHDLHHEQPHDLHHNSAVETH